jgi:hypothetical protein
MRRTVHRLLWLLLLTWTSTVLSCGGDADPVSPEVRIVSFGVDGAPVRPQSAITFSWTVRGATSVSVLFDERVVCENQPPQGSCAYTVVEAPGTYMAALVVASGERRNRTVVVERRDDISLVAIDPPSGSRVALDGRHPLISGTVTVTFEDAGPYHLFLGIHPGGPIGGDSCIWGGSVDLQLASGVPQEVDFQMGPNPGAPCPGPFTSEVVGVHLNHTPHTGVSAYYVELPITYEFE